jgi:hypothetical protein
MQLASLVMFLSSGSHKRSSDLPRRTSHHELQSVMLQVPGSARSAWESPCEGRVVDRGVTTARTARRHLRVGSRGVGTP